MTKILSGYLDTIAAASTCNITPEQMLSMIPFVAWLSLPTTSSIAYPLVHTCMPAPQKLDPASDLETVLLVALSLPLIRTFHLPLSLHIQV